MDWGDFKSKENRQNEIQLARSIEKNALLMTKLEEAQDEVDRSHSQISSQLRQLEEYKLRIRKLEEKLQNSQTSSFDFDPLPKIPDERDKKTEDLFQIIKNKDRVIETLTSNQIFSQEKLEELRVELENKNRDMEILQKRLKNTEKSIDTLFLNVKTEGEFVSELEHLKLDNQRLLNLLSKSAEYKFLTQFIDSTEGAHFVPGGKSSDETFNWVPKKVLKAIEIYKKAPDLSEDVIHTLMLEINKAFREREKNLVGKIKHESQAKIDDLKRQLIMRKPYDNISTSRQNSRLKSELKKANNEISMISQKSSATIPRLQDLEATLKMLNQLKSENEKLTRENKELKKAKTGKSQFLEGVGWLGEKVMKEKSQMNKLIFDILGEVKNEELSEKREWVLVNVT
jgi:hypothetical protein